MASKHKSKKSVLNIDKTIEVQQHNRASFPTASQGSDRMENRSLTRSVKSLMGELGIIDVWRELYPTSRDYTHFSSPHSVYRRIHYFLYSTETGLR